MIGWHQACKCSTCRGRLICRASNCRVAVSFLCVCCAPKQALATLTRAAALFHYAGLVRRQTTPDALLYKPAANGQNSEYWIVELKFCRDTDKEGKMVQAVEQHKGLCSAIQQVDRNATVHYMPLVIGVAGSIYKELSSHLVALGVNGQDVKATIRAIHLKTTNLLHWIYTTKQK